ncbi:MAG: SsrA-binding protein [Desulfobulbaceae bacterium A2]|nr:MAG: SsrA-binding protein [Desulfobulbaceae bacterium A2]
MGEKVVCRNKKAFHEYHIEETMEGGLVLSGAEVKSLRAGRANLVDGYAVVSHGEVWLRNVHITPYAWATSDQADPLRERKVLLHNAEIRRLTGKLKEKGLALIPLRIYFNEKSKAKVELGLARGKKQYDKRATLKEQDSRRELERVWRRSR